MPSAISPSRPPLHWYEIVVLAALATALVVYLPIVVQRVAVMGFGDTQVFFRAGWAIWSGFPLYEVTDHHGWSYHYPPTFALMMGAFADPLPGYAKPAWSLSFPVSVAVWYAISAAAILAALHTWALGIAAFVPRSADQRFWNGWWFLRAAPLLALLPFVGGGFGRGQPTALVLLSMIGFLVLYERQRPHAAAAALAIGITIKLFPAVLLIIPALRRDVRVLIATALWCAVFLMVIPAVCVGWPTTLQLYDAMWGDHLRGILTGAPKANIAAEITFTSYDMLSVAAMLTRIAANGLPAQAALPGWAMIAQVAFDAGLVTLIAFLGHGRFWHLRADQPPPASVLFPGATLCAALPIMLAVSQPNYVAFALPLVALAQIATWRASNRIGLSVPLFCWSSLMWLATIATNIPIWQPLRIVGFTTPLLLVLVFWGVCQRSALDSWRS